MPRRRLPPGLQLELMPPKEQWRTSGGLILLLGILLAVAAAAHYLQSLQKIAAAEAIARQTQPLQEAADIDPNDPETMAVREAAARLRSAWGTLFTALEQVPASEVNLLSIEPDITTGHVKLVAESPDTYAMLDYLRELSKQTGIIEAALTDYEIQQDKANSPVRFTLAATWNVAP